MKSTVLMSARGHFMLSIYDNGTLKEVIDEPNLIVLDSKRALSHAIAGDSADSWAISKIGFGSNNTLPTPNDSVLSTDAYIKPLNGSKIRGTIVRFDFTLDKNEANGKPINEFGLLTGNGTLFARKIRQQPLSKTNSTEFIGTWTIVF